MIKRLSIAFAALLTLMAMQEAGAQNTFALKTNLLHDATASVNLAAEYAFAPKWSVQLEGSLRLWDAYCSTLNHCIVRPEARYWFCERFNGLFASAYLLGGTATVGHFYDFSRTYRRFPNLDSFLLKDALLLSGGVGIGYDLILSRHWNVEFAASAGYMYVKGDEYDYYDQDSAPLLQGSIFDYVGPTALSVSIVYLF